MRGISAILIWLLAGALSQANSLSHANAQPPAKNVKVDLLSESATVHPGQEFWVGVRQKIAPGWHTYWINPGDAGEPMTLEWSLPEGFTAGAIEWPLPDAIPVASLTNFGYSNEAMLLVKMQAPATLAPGPVTLAAKARWLVCADVCIPENGDVALTLSGVADAGQAISSSQEEILSAHAAKLPKPSPWPAHVKADGEAVTLVLNGAGAQRAALSNPRFFPLGWGVLDNTAPQKAVFDGDLSLSITRGDLKDKPVDGLKGLLVSDDETAGAGVRRGYWIDARKQDAALNPALDGSNAPSDGAASAGGPATGLAGGGIGFWAALAFAALGGVILNLMPCVFPVLSLKALSFAAQRPGEGRANGLAYFSGVMASFAGLAGLLIALRASGATAGWGFQFQSPEFVLGMAALFFALGLNLSGVFSVSGAFTGAGDRLARKEGLSGYFFTGVLATLAATPCTAPFMGAALGYALTQPAFEAFAILMALGAGFAAPMALLSATPGLQRLLPKPGAWMETLKQFMAFPLYATAAWLVWVLSVQRGSDGVLAAAVGLIGVGFAAWLAGGGPSARSVWRRLAAPAAAVAVMVAAIGLVRMAEAPDKGAQAAGVLKADPFSPQKLSALRAEGRPVFVNFTAAWCITCKANERVALSSASLGAEFASRNIAYLVADWTNHDAEIGAILKSFGAAGVPLYVFYPGGAADPVVLPQLLTEAIVLNRITPLSQTQAKGNS